MESTTELHSPKRSRSVSPASSVNSFASNKRFRKSVSPHSALARPSASEEMETDEEDDDESGPEEGSKTQELKLIAMKDKRVRQMVLRSMTPQTLNPYENDDDMRNGILESAALCFSVADRVKATYEHKARVHIEESNKELDRVKKELHVSRQQRFARCISFV